MCSTGNCLASKVTGTFSRQIGQDYLNQVVGQAVTELVLSDTVSFELDPTYVPHLLCIEPIPFLFFLLN